VTGFGLKVGFAVGDLEGGKLGGDVGTRVGLKVGFAVGDLEGARVGLSVGCLVGFAVTGTEVGAIQPGGGTPHSQIWRSHR
jgi:hypothetical protein